MGAEREEQLQELEVLLSVFDENFVKYSEIDGNFKGSLTIEFKSLPSPINISITDNGVIKSIRVTNLPPASLNFELPPEYPSTSSPKFNIECIWMSCQLLEDLFSILKEQCEANAGLPVLYFCCQAIVDTIRERITGDICLDEAPFIKEKKLTPKEALNLASDTSEKAEDHNFEAGCYDCEICFNNKTGKDCVRIQPCGHVYCLECVSGYVVEKTRGGKMVGVISCLGNDCDSPISQTIIKKCIGEEEFERYERLVLDTALFLMEDVAICPRKSCQTSVIISKDNPRLGLCSCGYSFCVLCKRVYHGLNNCHKLFLPPKMSIRSKVDPQYEFTYDRNQIVKIWNTGNEKLREEMAAWYGGYNKLKELVDTIQNEDWIELNSKPCPKCGTAIEKNLGCNKMQCIKCKIKFCWLCDQILYGNDPYAHFRTGNCANKLFQGTFEDEDQEYEGPAANFIPMVVQDDDDFDVVFVVE